MIDASLAHDGINIILLTLLVITAIGIVATRNLLTATITMSIFSLLMAAMYLVLGAPDVAITEAAIGAGISTVLFLAVILLTGEKEAACKRNIVPLAAVIFTGAVLIYATLDLPSFGSANTPASTHVAPYYLNQSYGDIGIPNTVTSILASYRGFDTMGEVFVIFTAGIACLMLLGGSAPKRKRK